MDIVERIELFVLSFRSYYMRVDSTLDQGLETVVDKGLKKREEKLSEVNNTHRRRGRPS